MGIPDNENNSESYAWIRGALVSSIGVAIGIASLVLFCHAMGLNLQDEGWSSEGDIQKANRGKLLISFLGFGISTVVFWLGFHQTTKSK